MIHLARSYFNSCWPSRCPNGKCLLGTLLYGTRHQSRWYHGSWFRIRHRWLILNFFLINRLRTSRSKSCLCWFGTICYRFRYVSVDLWYDRTIFNDLIQYDLDHTNNSSIQNNWFLAKKMLPTTMLEVTTLLAKSSLTMSLTESENSRTIAPVSKVSWSSTLSVVVLDLGSLLFWWKDFQVRFQNIEFHFT